MSNVVRRGQAGAWKPWAAPQVGKHHHGKSPMQNEADSRQDAYKEGFARGHDEGLQAARGAMNDMASRIESILAALQQPLAAADDEVIEKISSLAIALAKRLVRRELRTDRAEVVGVVREALAVLPVGLRDIRLHLHPDDAKLVSEILAPAGSDAAWTLVEDPVITRGGCRISSPTSQVDATIETRLDRVINTMLGGERGEDAAMPRADANE